ncbi:MAG: type I restriction endonuclease subunit R, partial [Rectinemataceae bacterium]
MNTVGQVEKMTQERVKALFKDRLGWDYLGYWKKEVDNSCVEEEYLKAWLGGRNIPSAWIDKALRKLDLAAGDASKSLYDRNKDVYDLLRYGVKINPGVGDNTETVWLIDWKTPASNNFAVAEEVTVVAADAKASTKRPDLVLYVNGIALGIIELKRSTVSVSEGIRQNLDNQKKEFIEPFFATMQLLMAGNESEGLRYGTIETSEKYYLRWVEDEGPHAAESNLLDRHLLQLCDKTRFLELIHDFIVFDAGVKKLCRQNQYFGVKRCQASIAARQGGIIWHTQGSGKSLTMVWLATWILANRNESRVLIVTDRRELDTQIETVFKGVNEQIYRTTSTGDLIAQLNRSEESLLCTLVHKFGLREDEEEASREGAKELIRALAALPQGFLAKGDLHVFVDECHRSQSGDLHKAMRAILPKAIFIGFTGTPLLRSDKGRSIETFGPYIHTYKFDQAVREGVVLDLRYEARDIDQSLTSDTKIDEWFEAKTKNLNNLAKAQLKKKWGTMQQVLSAQSRLEKIVSDIVFDMNLKPRLMDFHGNAMLVAGSIYEACKYFELFKATELKGKCAVVSSYVPAIADITGETTGEGDTENLFKYGIYKDMLGGKSVEAFEKEVKKKFVEQPGQMRLLIVVDKLLTGFDAPSATYLYIDKQMQDHGLFQAICRVNRLDGETKDYGYIVDYKDLFMSLEGAVNDYTSGALEAYDKDDVAGLLKNRLEEARHDLEDARDKVKAICELVEKPHDAPAYFKVFLGEEHEGLRLKFYQFVSGLIRSYGDIAGELSEAGYTDAEIQAIQQEVDHYAKARDEVKLASGDYIDLKSYEPAMRHLIDTYIRAEESEKISAFNDLTLINLIVE